MRVLVHDYSGHPFQAELSRELSRRGHDVVHSFCEAYVSGKGRLSAEPGETLRFRSIGRGVTLHKMRYRRRVLEELLFGLQLVAQVIRVRPHVALVANTPIPTLVVFAAYMALTGTPWVLWHQDVQAVAIRSLFQGPVSRIFRLGTSLIEAGERWCSRSAAAIVVIADSFLDVHRLWRTETKVTVIPNWAPLDEIVPTDRRNQWSCEHGLDDEKTLLYSGTLGLKHNPKLLVRLAREVIDAGTPVRLVVVNDGPAVEVLRAEAASLDVPITLLPFQAYDRLPEVLGSGDVLLVLLERTSGSFSVPSKTLSYMCAGRPILGLMPSENQAAELLAASGNCVLAPETSSLPAAAKWVGAVLADERIAETLGMDARALAEHHFALEACADEFEQILLRAVAA